MERSVSIDWAQVAAAAMDGIGIIEEAEYSDVNDRLAEIHGYPAARELVGRSWEELYTPVDRGFTAGELLARVREEGEWRGRASGHNRNGDRVPVELSMRATDGGTVCVVRERTAANGAGQRRRGADGQSRQPVHDTPGPVGFSQTLLDAVDDVIYVVDEEDDVVEWNHRLNERLGYTDAEIAEMTLPEFLPEDRRELLGEEGTRMVDFPERTREMAVVSKDGKHIPFELRGVTYTDETDGGRYRVGIARDITARKERERELERYETIVETVDDGVYVLNEDLRVETANERFFEMLAQFGFSRDEVRELHAHDLVVDEDERAALEAEIRRAIERESHIGSFEMSAETPDGDRIVCESRFRLYPEPTDGHRGCIGILRDITERKERERQLARQRDELDTLNRINELLLAVVRDLFESPTHEDIEQTVCARLADSDLYQFAWIGTPDVGGDRLVPEASAGVDDDYIESIDVTTGEGATGRGPGGRAFRTGSIQVSQDIETDPTFEPWRRPALERNVRSAAAIPLTYDGTTYGILAVYASRPLAFSQREQRGFEILGEAIGYAINASRTRQLLFAEQVTELELRLVDPDEFVVETTERLGCRLSLEGYVSTDGERWLLYFSLPGGESDRFVETLRTEPTVGTVRTNQHGPEHVVALTTESVLLGTFASLGGRVTSGSIDSGVANFLVELPQTTDPSSFLEQVRSTYPDTEVLAKRDDQHPVEKSVCLSGDELVNLTDRQRQALETAYRTGYFEWPRENSADDVAELLGISRPTMLAHLRKAENELFSLFFAGDGRDERRETGIPWLQ